MAESYTRTDQAGSPGVSPKSDATSSVMGQAASMAQSAVDQAKSTGRDIKDRAADLASASADTLKNQAADLADKAKDFASQTGDKVKQTVNEQRGVGADYVGNLADTMRRAAREFDADLPIAGTYIRKAAAQVESVSDAVRNGDLEDLVKGAQSFARRQPTAFLGLSVLAGFGVVRFLKSSADPADRSSGRNFQSSGDGHRLDEGQSRSRSESSTNRGAGYSHSGTAYRPS